MTPLRGPDDVVYASAQGQVSDGGGVFSLASKDRLQLLINDPDFTTAARIEQALNRTPGEGTAKAEDSGGVVVRLPQDRPDGAVESLAMGEDVEVEPDSPARLVFNEKTGTVVMGADLRISRVAISHRNLSVQVETEVNVQQPMEEPDRVLVLDRGASIGDLVNDLNKIGATARDMIAIFQAIRAAGALQAEIIVQ